jgi:hypothetical protein
MEEAPGAIVFGLAAIVTVGPLPDGVGEGVLEEAALPVPHAVQISRNMSATKMNEAEHKKVGGSFRINRAFVPAIRKASGLSIFASLR